MRASRRAGDGEHSANGPLLLGIDLGTSAVKALVVDLRGRVVGRGGAEYPTRNPAPDRAEQEPADWWAATLTAVGGALAQTDARHVAALAVDGQCHGAVLLDGRDGLLGPAIVWLDRRSSAEVATLTDSLGAERVIDALGGPLATGFQAPTLAWLRAHEPVRFERIRRVISPKDWLRLRLIGAITGDPSDASATGLLELRTRQWWSPMLDTLGLTAGALPPLLDAQELAGALLAGAAAALGLPAGIPVAVGAADTPAGLLGAGLVDADASLLSISTGATLVVPAREPVTDPTGSAHTLCAALPPTPATAGWYQMFATLAAGAALRWLRDAVLRDERPDAFERLVSLAAAEPVGANGLVFLPHLAGERGPRAAARTRGAFVGLTLAHGAGALVRAVMEGVTFSLADAADTLSKSAPLPERLVMAGGGARSDTWTQMVADALGRPVDRLVAEEGAALGACLLAGSAAGLLDVPSAAGAWARLTAPVHPDAARRDAYAAARAAYRSADDSLLEVARRRIHR